MTRDNHRRDRERAIEAVAFALATGEATAPPPPLYPRDEESMGTALEKRRRALGWTSRKMASAMGVPYNTFLRWQGDADLPDAESLFKVCDVLEERAVRVLRRVAETARRILWHALALAAGKQSRLTAARRRGPEHDDADEVLVTGIPMALRRGLAEGARTTPDDVAGLARHLRQVAARDRRGQEREVYGVAAGLVLDGEEAWDE